MSSTAHAVRAAWPGRREQRALGVETDVVLDADAVLGGVSGAGAIEEHHVEIL